MTSKFPTRFELKCSGISFIISQICFSIAISLFSINYNIYNVQQQSDIKTLHNILSSSKHRTDIEIATAFIFISFPFFLVALHGLNKLLTAVFDSTPGEMTIYVMETSYTIWVTISLVVIPALSLIAVCFEWSFHEYTPSDDYLATGYYIQAYVMLYQLEMIDCVAIADATFMIALFITPAIIRYGSATGNHKLKRIKSVIAPETCPLFVFSMIMLLMFSFIVIFMIVLFEFMQSGFSSPAGHAKFLLVWTFIWKILVGIRIFVLGRSEAYDSIKLVVDGFYQEQKMPLSMQEQLCERDGKQMIFGAIDEDDEVDYNSDEEEEDDDFEPPTMDIANIQLKAKHIMPELETVTPMAKGPNIRL